MTEDEILSMPAGREMDALIAEKVMGWHYDKTKSKMYWLTDDNKRAWLRYFDSDAPENEFEPSTEISHAWEVVKKGDIHLECGHGEWECWIPGGGVAYAETAPLAICRAALSAVMEK